MEIVLGMIEEGASDEMILKYLKISKERLEQIKKSKSTRIKTYYIKKDIGKNRQKITVCFFIAFMKGEKSNDKTGCGKT